MACQQLEERLFFYRLIGKCHQLFQIVLHIIFKIANYGNKEVLPKIDNFLLLSSATSLGEKIRRKKLKSVDLIQAYITRIQEVNPFINAVVAERYEKALQEAKSVDEMLQKTDKSVEQLERETPFLGVPFTSKEIICVADMPATAGLVSFKGNLAAEDSEAVRLMRKAGAIPIAVTNIPELCMWSETHNKVYGRSSNPYDTSRGVGGSSGGEGAIIAAAGSVIGIGSDIAGSIRIPSCFNGIFGHKPTPGIVSNDKCFRVLNKEVECFLTAGPMCRYATDLLPMFKVMAGNDVDRLLLDEPVKLSNLKIFYMEDAGDYGLFTRVHPDIKVAMAKVLRHFEHGYKIKPIRIELPIMREAVKIYTASVQSKGGFQIAKGLSRTKKPVNLFLELLLWFIGLSKHTLHILLVGLIEKLQPNFNASDTSSSNFRSGQVDPGRVFHDLLGDNGIFLYPTWPEPSPHHNEMLFKPYNCGYTALFNACKLPVTQCPLGLSESGLPIGIQVVSNVMNDRVCLAVAVEIEKALGGWVPPCPVVE